MGPFPPPHGGVQTNVVSIHERLKAQGHQSVVVNLTRHRQSGVENVFFPETAIETCLLLNKLRADIVHLHIGGDISNRLLGLSVFLQQLPRRKTLCTLHSGGYPSTVPAIPPLRLKAIRAVLRRFDALVGVNQALVNFFVECGMPQSRVHLIAPFPSVAKQSEEVRMDAKLQAFCELQKPLLVTVGLLEPEYDLPLQMRAIRRIKEVHPDAGLVIVGSGSLEGELSRAVAGEFRSEQILMTGDLPHKTTLSLIRKADVLLRTTLYDGDSVAVREALQVGTKVVATDTGMRPANVFLAPIGDSTAVAIRVLDVLRLPPAGVSQPTDSDGIDEILRLYSSIAVRHNAA